MNRSYLNLVRNTTFLSKSSKLSKVIRLLLIVLFVLIIPWVSFGQSCNLVKSGDFTGSVNTSNWVVQTASTGWHYSSSWAPNEIYIEADGITNTSLKQSLTGLISGPLIVSFKIKGQNASRSSTCPTTATLVIKVGGTTYLTISNPINNTNIADSNIATSNGAAFVTSNFPLTVAGASSAAITQGTITLTIPWSGATVGDLEFVATTSNTVSGSCVAWGGDDWFLDDISLVTPDSTSFNMTGVSVCAGNNVTIGLGGSQLGVNYQLQIGGVNTGSAIAGTGSAISFGSQSATGIYTVLATAGISTCTKIMSGSVSISPNLPASVNIAALPAGTICYGTSVTFTASPANGGTTPVYQWKLNGTNVGANSPTYTNATLVNSDVVTCVMTSNATPCSTGSPVASNSIAIATTGPTAAGATICAGGSASLTSSYVCANGNNQTSGPNNAGTVISDSTLGTKGWDNPGNITATGTPYATVDTYMGDTTRFLKGTNYGFSIPINATVVGITVIINRYANGGSIEDNSIKIVKGGVVSGVEKSSGATWPTSFGTATFGGSSSLWGTTWTAADINDSTFGVVLSAKNNSFFGLRTLSVDYMQITITYTVPGSLDWFTASSGGTKIGSGSSFNPVGAAGSGLANTNTAGTTPYYVECSSNAGCRTPVSFVINALPATPILGNPIQPDCKTATGSLVLSGLPAFGTINQTGTVTASYPITATTMTISGLAVGSYSFTASNGLCGSPATGNAVINPLTIAIWDGIAWTNGPPTASQALVFSGNYNSSGDLTACSCTVDAGKNVVINTGNTLTVTNEVTVSGTLTFEDTASLVQTNNDSVNSGNISYKSIVPLVRVSDYVYWSSPVASQNLNISSFYMSGIFYSYDDFATPEDWNKETAATIMQTGKGYIIRGPITTTTPVPPLPPPPPGLNYATFTGVSSNGIKTVAIGATGTSNLLGNPYPSAINADTFLATNNALIEGTVYFWTHNTDIQLASNIASGKAGSGALAYTSDDYASYNGTGGVAISGGIIPTGKIAAGQAFFTTSKSIGGSVVFNNAMRLAGTTLADKTGVNQQFFKTKNTNTKTANTIEKNRVWLNLANAEGAFKQTLVGYITGATNEYDSRFDGETFDGNEFVDFYSINQDKNLVIQGRALPFDENDEVPLGYRTTIEGVFTINIDQLDGALTNQAVFLEDKLANTVFDLKDGNYTFNTVAGTFNNRFVLRYTNKTLGAGEFHNEINQVVVSVKNKHVKINSFAETIDRVEVYDLSGRQIYKKDKVNDSELLITNFNSNHQALVVKTILQNGKMVTDKIIY